MSLWWRVLVQLTLLDLLIPIPSIPIHSHPLHRPAAERDRCIGLTHSARAPNAGFKTPTPTPTPPIPPIIPCGGTCSLEQASSARLTAAPTAAAVTPSLLRVHLFSTNTLHGVRRRVSPSGLRQVLSHHPARLHNFSKPTRSPSLLLLPPSRHRLDPTSQSNFLRLRSVVELCKNVIDSNLGQRLLVWSIYYNPTDRSLNSTLYPPHDIPLSTGMCNGRTHRSYLYAHGGERHARNTQVAHEIL